MDNIKNSTLLTFEGGEVKSTDEGVVEGMAIVFGSEIEPDQSSKRDFFTTDSFVRGKSQFELPLYHDHGLGEYNEEIGEAVLTKEDDGWKAVAKINLATEAGKAVYDLVKTKAYGFSTGALTHLVERESRKNNTNFLKRWVAGELSLTERPAERKAVVESVKSINGEIVAEEWEVSDESILVALYAEDGSKLWDAEDGYTKIAELGNAPKKIELKSASGSITYNLFYYDDEGEGGGADITVSKWGSAEEALAGVQDIINKAVSELKSVEPEEKDFEQRVTDIVKSIVTTDNKDVDELEKELENKNKELAELRNELASREDALTIANEKNAQLEILAGASETINRYKDKNNEK